MELTFLDIINLVPLFIIGIICSYTDIKKGKIFNKWIVLGFYWGFCFYLSLFLYNLFFITQEANNQYLLDVGRNTLVAFFVGYLLWNLKLWSAGDAKFFTLCSFLIPLKFYSKSYLSFFPSFNLLINFFVPLLLIFSCIALVGTIKSFFQEKKKNKTSQENSVKKTFVALSSFFKRNIKSFLTYIFVFIIIEKISLLEPAFPEIGFLFNPLFLFLLMFTLQGFIEKIKKKNKRINYIVQGVIVLYFFDSIINAKISVLFFVLKNAFFLFLFVNLFRQSLHFYIEKQEIEKVQIENLYAGAIVSTKDLPLIRERLEKKKKIEIFGKIKAEGLVEEQVCIIKEVFAGEGAELKVYKTFPFAPFMFLSIILSLITQVSFVDFLKIRL